MIIKTEFFTNEVGRCVFSIYILQVTGNHLLFCTDQVHSRSAFDIHFEDFHNPKQNECNRQLYSFSFNYY